MDSQDVERLKEVFSSFDQDKDGFISREELELAVKTFDSSTSMYEIDDLMNELDIDRDGKISLDEFTKFMNVVNSTKSSDEEIEYIFGLFDRDGDGVINFEEFEKLLIAIRLEISEEDAKKMFDEYRQEKSGIDVERLKEITSQYTKSP